MVTKTTIVLDPTAKPSAEEISIAPGVGDLNDQRIGFLWNGKPNGDILLSRIKERLAQRFNYTEANWQQRIGPVVSAGADDPVIKELVSTCDIVINAICD